MADEGPPKPKPGSLKDRIKQFEVSSSSSSNSPAPPPLRPKPGTLGQWKPKTLDPPSPNKQTIFSASPQEASQTSEDHAHASGMSATDAMSSITKGGGSLKERMAALQGKGAFGDTSNSPAPPLPSNEGKPRVWRVSPAPPVEPKGVEESTEYAGDNAEAISQERSPIERSPMSPNDEAKAMLTAPNEGAGAATSETGNEDEEKTEQEQERERRAAIAARMARLGGARVGMPVGFGIAAKGLHGGAKPAIPAKPRLVTPGDTGSAGSSAPPSAMSPAPPSSTDETGNEKAVRQNTLDTALKVPLPKSEGTLLTPGSMDDGEIPSESDATTSGKLVPPRSPAIPKSPDTMPIPALPKRAAGPRRKKSAKELKATSGSSGDAETPPIPSSDPTQEANEAQVTTPTQEEAPPAAGEIKPMLRPQLDQPNVGLTEEPASTVDDLASAAPSEIATPPPASPSVMATEDEDEGSIGEGPSRRRTIELSTHEEKIVEEEGSQLLTPRPRSDSSDQMGGASLSTALGNMMQSEPKADGENPVEDTAGEDDAEENEAARKRRVAEKMARLGAVNPFAPGGFTSPVSPHSDKEGQAVVKKEEDNADKKLEEESGQATVTKNTADNDSDVDLAAHESEPNVPVLSQSHSRLLSQDAQNEENDPAEGGTGDQDALDGDVDYPMMSPLTGGNHETRTPFALPNMGDEAASRKAAASKSNPQYDDEKEYSEDDDERADTETIHDRRDTEDELPPKRITRMVPPPPQSPRIDYSLSLGPSSPSSPPRSPTAYEFDDSSPRAALAAALARRAPRPPPDHQSSVELPPHLISPTPSPPLRPFVREGAPSPPSLKASSSIDDDEEMYEEDEVEYVDDELSEGADEAQETHIEEHDESPIMEEWERTPSPPLLPKASPPPLPGGRPPVSNVRRSIPHPPRQALSSTLHADVSSRPPLPIPKQSMMVVPSSPSDGGEREVDYAADVDDEDTQRLQQATGRSALPPPRQNKLTSQYAPRASGKAIQEREIMDDEEGDPVDPDFVGSRQSPPETGMAAARTRKNPVLEVEEDEEALTSVADPEVDSEAARRRTIAERMAKLGGIKFGVPVTSRPSPIRKHSESREETEQEATENKQDLDVDGDSNQSPEEVERSRRAGIAARMAAMGGRGFGMYGAGAVPTAVPTTSAKMVATPSPGHAPNASLASPPPPALPGSRPKQHSRDYVTHAINRPPPPAPVNNTSDSAQGGETSESEVEMVNLDTEEEGEMVEEVEDEEPELVETPPAPPNRSGRPPIPAASRPPPPPPSSGLTSPPLPAGRRTHPPPSLQNDYEVVDDDLRTSPSVPRVSHSRSIPPQPITESATQLSMDSSGQWELPNIPSGSFDLGNYGKGPGAAAAAGTSTAEKDASWTKVEQEVSGARAKASTSNQPPSDPFLGPAPTSVSTEALTSLAHRMGPTIVSSAQHIHEKSKRTVIGDGSSISFLLMVLSSISGASTASFGHLVYAQTGGAVQRRLGDIMPGDVVALYEARFKGHKGGLGLGAYSVSWGTKEEPVLGIVTEFEGKKSKIKAFAVNQHPNSYPTIDTPSYKLDDLKAGTLKVFRVAETS